MKANNLAIDDLVYVPRFGVRKVAQITRKKIGFHNKPCECHMNYERLMMIEPIPLTEEMLLKNGFGFVTGENGAKYLVNQNFEIRVMEDGSFYQYLYDFDYEIKYVHELFHLLRIAKREDVIMYFNINFEIEERNGK